MVRIHAWRSISSPNSVAPSARQLADALENIFLVEDWHEFGSDYDQTLLAWRRNFEPNWDRIRRPPRRDFLSHVAFLSKRYSHCISCPEESVLANRAFAQGRRWWLSPAPLAG